MSKVENQPDELIEALVRKSLERSGSDRPASRVRPAPGRVAGSRGEGTTGGARRPPPPARVGSWAWGLSAAAAVFLLMSVWLLRPSLVLASPEAWSARPSRASAAARSLLPCRGAEGFRRLRRMFPDDLAGPVTRLWTRGDQFWVESVNPERRWDWGRDENNHVWFAFGPHRAVRLEPGEMPRWLGPATFTVSGSSNSWERSCAISISNGRPADDVRPATQVVRASMKPGRSHPSIKSAVLEIDAESRVVRRMVIERMTKGQPFATVTCTLVETKTLDDGKFQLEGHLVAPYTFTPATSSPPAGASLTRWFGPKSGSWFQLPERNVEPHESQGNHQRGQRA